jgi:hypothetical protein
MRSEVNWLVVAFHSPARAVIEIDPEDATNTRSVVSGNLPLEKWIDFALREKEYSTTNALDYVIMT